MNTLKFILSIICSLSFAPFEVKIVRMSGEEITTISCELPSLSVSEVLSQLAEATGKPSYSYYLCDKERVLKPEDAITQKTTLTAVYKKFEEMEELLGRMDGLGESNPARQLIQYCLHFGCSREHYISTKFVYIDKFYIYDNQYNRIGDIGYPIPGKNPPKWQAKFEQEIPALFESLKPYVTFRFDDNLTVIITQECNKEQVQSLLMTILDYFEQQE